MKSRRKSIRRKALFSLFRQNWNIGVAQRPIHEVAGLEGHLLQQDALDSIQWMEERRGSFRADPFPMMKSAGDGLRIYHEALDWSHGLGRIDYVDYAPGDGFGTPVVCLESAGHLSYPFVLQHQGVNGILPEHSSMRDLSFYPIRDDGSPSEKINIINGLGLIDSTIVRQDDTLWLFATVAGPNDNSELHLFSSKELEGPWVAHEGNPVKVDPGSARPAGAIFSYRSSLFRPAQDCRRHYGAGIIVHEIEALSENSFREQAVSEVRLNPESRYDFGCHTLSSAGPFTVVDGARLESKIHPLLDGVQRYLRSSLDQL